MTSQLESQVGFSISVALQEKLRGHGKVGLVQDGSTTGYFFQSSFPEVTDMESLIDCLKRRGLGIPKTHFLEDASYPGVIDDINQLIGEGKVIAIKSKEHEHVIFPRNEHFETHLAGVYQANSSDPQVLESLGHTLHNLQPDLRRGDLVGVRSKDGMGLSGRVWRRVSTELRGAQTEWAKVTSASSEQPLRSKDPDWKRPFTDSKLPLDDKPAESGPLLLSKFGCSNDIRDLWYETASQLPKGEKALQDELIQEGMLELESQDTRKRPAPKRDEKKRKRARARIRSVTNSQM